MKEQEVLQILNEVGALITNGHFVYTSDLHGTEYVNKDAVYPNTPKISLLCEAIAEHFANYGVEAVIAPALGGIVLSQWTAHHLTEMTGSLYEVVYGVFAEKKEESVIKAKGGGFSVGIFCGAQGQETNRLIILQEGEELVIKKNAFEIKRGYAKLVANKKVLVVEDVLTTGGSAKKVIEATRRVGGEVVGLGVLCNRGGVTPKDVGNPPELFSLVDIKLNTWTEEECALTGPCSKGIPINAEVGKGEEYLARKKVEV